MTALHAVESLGLVSDVVGLRTQLRGMLSDLENASPLPGPTRYATDHLPGAYWETGVSIVNWSASKPLTVIALAEDVGMIDAPIYLTDPAFPRDILCLTAEQARTVARSLLAAADMAGSPLIARRCGGIR